MMIQPRFSGMYVSGFLGPDHGRLNVRLTEEDRKTFEPLLNNEQRKDMVSFMVHRNKILLMGPGRDEPVKKALAHQLLGQLRVDVDGIADELDDPAEPIQPVGKKPSVMLKEYSFANGSVALVSMIKAKVLEGKERFSRILDDNGEVSMILTEPRKGGKEGVVIGVTDGPVASSDNQEAIDQQKALIDELPLSPEDKQQLKGRLDRNA